MKLLAIDFETFSDKAAETAVTEIGAHLVEWPGTGAKLNSITRFNRLLYHPMYTALDPFIVELTGISDELLKAEGILPKEAFKQLVPLVEQAELVMAHNKSFDQTVFESVCTRLKIPFPVREWLCTLNDFPWPRKFTCRKLGHLAFEHKMKMDDRELHRAINDCDLLLELVFNHYDFNLVLEYARSPWLYIQADIPAPWNDGGAGKTHASKLGYGWEKCKGTEEPVFSKKWVKRTKESQLNEEIQRLQPYNIIVHRGI